MALKDTAIKQAKPVSKPYTLTDGDGLSLHPRFPPISYGNISRQLSVISRPSRFSKETLGTPGRNPSTSPVDRVAVDRSVPGPPRFPATAPR